MIALVMFAVQLPVYDLLEGGLNVVLTVLALALREAHVEPARA